MEEESSITMEGHRIHLKDLFRKECNVSYRRDDYLSADHQNKIWRDEVKYQHGKSLVHRRPSSPKDVISEDVLRLSPSSVFTNPTSEDLKSTDSLVSSHYYTPASPSDICIRWREKIVEWMYLVIDRFDLSREIVSISAFYLDRYLSKHYVDEELFRQVAMTSIYLAIKIHSPKKASIHMIASMCKGEVTVSQIETMELQIMNDLQWHLFPPTPMNFISNLYPLLSATLSSDGTTSSSSSRKRSRQEDDMERDLQDSLDLSTFLVELSVCAYPFIMAKPSSIAVAAMLYSFEHFDIPQDVLGYFKEICSQYDVDMTEVETCCTLLGDLYQAAMPQEEEEVSCPLISDEE